MGAEPLFHHSILLARLQTSWGALSNNYPPKQEPWFSDYFILAAQGHPSVLWIWEKREKREEGMEIPTIFPFSHFHSESQDSSSHVAWSRHGCHVLNESAKRKLRNSTVDTSGWYPEDIKDTRGTSVSWSLFLALFLAVSTDCSYLNELAGCTWNAKLTRTNT
jgi:hypothetical protein